VQQQLLVRVAELQLLIARNQLLPQLSMNALYQLNGLGQQLDSAEAVMTGSTLKALNPVIANMQRAAGLNSQPGSYSNFVTWQVGFTFQAPLGMRAPLANTRNAQYTLLRARAYLQQVVHQTTHSLARFFLEIDANYKQFKAAARLRAASFQRLEAQRNFLEFGKITLDRYLDAVSQYATAVANEAQYKTTYNISIVALEEAKGTLLAYDNIAVAEGPHPAKAYIQARDIQGAHHQHHISPDGPQTEKVPVGPLNPDPSELNPPPGVEGRQAEPPQPGPAGPLGPRPAPFPPYTPASLLPPLSQNSAAPGTSGSAASAATGAGGDVKLTSGGSSGNSNRNQASLIDPTVPGMGANSVAAALGRIGSSSPGAAAARAGSSAGAPALTPSGSAGAGTVPSRTTPQTAPPLGTTTSATRPAKAATDDLPPLPVSIDLPPLPPK
jgi:Outer membrane efflux protein